MSLWVGRTKMGQPSNKNIKKQVKNPQFIKISFSISKTLIWDVHKPKKRTFIILNWVIFVELMSLMCDMQLYSTAVRSLLIYDFYWPQLAYKPCTSITQRLLLLESDRFASPHLKMTIFYRILRNFFVFFVSVRVF